MFSKPITTSRLASCAALLLAFSAKGAFGDTAIDNDTFQNDPAAEVNGQQTNGNDPDNCNTNKTDNNCPQQPDWQGPYTKDNSFPTYYYVKYCGDLDQWRILYDVYFTKDTGHKSDWEWAVMVFKNNGNGGYNRDSVIMEQEGNHGYSAWSSIPEAFIDDIYNNDGSNGNHAKLYIAKWHHSIQITPNSSFKSTCPPGFKDDFRANEYYWGASDNLVSDDVIDPSWVWGKADSFPTNFHDGGAHDSCHNL